MALKSVFSNNYLWEDKFFLLVYCIVWWLRASTGDMVCQPHQPTARRTSLWQAIWCCRLSYLLVQSAPPWVKIPEYTLEELKTTDLQITSKQPGGCGTWLCHQVKTNLDTVEIWRQACPLAHRAPLPARSSGLAWRMPRRSGPSANIGWAYLDERNTTWQIPMPLEILLAES